MRRSTDVRNSISAGLWQVLQDWHGNPHRDRLSCILSPHVIPRRNSRLPNGTPLEEGTKRFWQPLAEVYGSTKSNTPKYKNHYRISPKEYRLNDNFLSVSKDGT